MNDLAARKARAALVSVFASGGLALAKFVVGIMSGSLAILSEAFHSLVDVAATVMTLFAVRIADKPADDTHHYGHGKFESVVALIETGLLFVISGWVLYEATTRLFGEPHAVEITPIVIGVLVLSIIVDFWRARVLSRTAKETNSHALEADALHFTSDMVSSAIVLVGLGLVWLGYPQGDALAAMAVALFVAVAGYRLGKRTIDVLTDAAPSGVAERLHLIVAAAPGVAAIDSIRVRPVGGTAIADVSVRVARTMPLDRVVEVKSAVADAIAAAFPTIEPQVTANPIAIDDETVRERVVLIAATQRLAVHHVTVQHLGGRLSISLDLEVAGDLPLGEAHEVASRLEASIRADFGAETEVETHIEPLEDDGIDGVDVPAEQRDRLATVIAGLVPQGGTLSDAHSVRVRRTSRGLYVTLHCRAAPETPVATVHRCVDDLERAIRLAIPGVARVVTHAEPVRG